MPDVQRLGSVPCPDCVSRELRSAMADRDARIAILERVICEQAHVAGIIGSGSEGSMRGRLMSISNALNMVIGRGQSSHGDQFDSAGKIAGERDGADN
jgi:hypothetical protein